jgi:hypothetical protein
MYHIVIHCVAMDGEKEEPRERDPGRRERKQRVLHTRISDDLAEDIRRVAEDLRVPVSNLVRNVLEDVFSVVEVVTDNVGDLVEDVVDEADRAATHLARRVRTYARESRESEAGAAEPEEPRFPEVLGWQPLILNAERDCAACGRRLERGEQALLGLTASGPGSTFLCRDCAP